MKSFICDVIPDYHLSSFPSECHEFLNQHRTHTFQSTPNTTVNFLWTKHQSSHYFGRMCFIFTFNGLMHKQNKLRLLNIYQNKIQDHFSFWRPSFITTVLNNPYMSKVMVSQFYGNLFWCYPCLILMFQAHCNVVYELLVTFF